MTCVLEYIQYTVRRFGGGEHRHCDSLCVFYTTAISIHPFNFVVVVLVIVVVVIIIVVTN